MWGAKGRGETPIFIPSPELCLEPIVVQAGKVVSIDGSGVKNDGVLVIGSPKLSKFAAIEWTTADGSNAQVFLNADTLKLGPPVYTVTDGIGKDVSAYNIKNPNAGAVTLHVRGM